MLRLTAWKMGGTSHNLQLRLRKGLHSTIHLVSLSSRPIAVGQSVHRTNHLLSTAFTKYHHKMISAAPRRLPITRPCRSTTSGLPPIKFLGDNLFTLCIHRRPSHATVTGDNWIKAPRIRLHPQRPVPTKNSSASRWRTHLPATDEPGKPRPTQILTGSGVTMPLYLPCVRIARPAPMALPSTRPATDRTVDSEEAILLQTNPFVIRHILSEEILTTYSLPHSAGPQRTPLLRLLRGIGPSLLDNNGTQRRLTLSTPHRAFIPSQRRATT